MRATNNVVNHDILPGSSFDRENYQSRCTAGNQYDNRHKTNAISEFVNIVDKDVSLRPKRLSECCSCCIIRRHSKSSRKHYALRSSRQTSGRPSGESSYTLSTSNVSGSQKKRNEKRPRRFKTSFKTKHIQSSPCTCNYSGLTKSVVKELRTPAQKHDSSIQAGRYYNQPASGWHTININTLDSHYNHSKPSLMHDLEVEKKESQKLSYEKINSTKIKTKDEVIQVRNSVKLLNRQYVTAEKNTYVQKDSVSFFYDIPQKDKIRNKLGVCDKETCISISHIEFLTTAIDASSINSIPIFNTLLRSKRASINETNSNCMVRSNTRKKHYIKSKQVVHTKTSDGDEPFELRIIKHDKSIQCSNIFPLSKVILKNVIATNNKQNTNKTGAKVTEAQHCADDVNLEKNHGGHQKRKILQDDQLLETRKSVITYGAQTDGYTLKRCICSFELKAKEQKFYSNGTATLDSDVIKRGTESSQLATFRRSSGTHLDSKQKSFIWVPVPVQCYPVKITHQAQNSEISSVTISSSSSASEKMRFYLPHRMKIIQSSEIISTKTKLDSYNKHKRNPLVDSALSINLVSREHTNSSIIVVSKQDHYACDAKNVNENKRQYDKCYYALNDRKPLHYKTIDHLLPKPSNSNKKNVLNSSKFQDEIETENQKDEHQYLKSSKVGFFEPAKYYNPENSSNSISSLTSQSAISVENKKGQSVTNYHKKISFRGHDVTEKIPQRHMQKQTSTIDLKPDIISHLNTRRCYKGTEKFNITLSVKKSGQLTPRIPKERAITKVETPNLGHNYKEKHNLDQNYVIKIEKKQQNIVIGIIQRCLCVFKGKKYTEKNINKDSVSPKYNTMPMSFSKIKHNYKIEPLKQKTSTNTLGNSTLDKSNGIPANYVSSKVVLYSKEYFRNQKNITNLMRKKDSVKSITKARNSLIPLSLRDVTDDISSHHLKNVRKISSSNIVGTRSSFSVGIVFHKTISPVSLPADKNSVSVSNYESKASLQIKKPTCKTTGLRPILKRCFGNLLFLKKDVCTQKFDKMNNDVKCAKHQIYTVGRVEVTNTMNTRNNKLLHRLERNTENVHDMSRNNINYHVDSNLKYTHPKTYSRNKYKFEHLVPSSSSQVIRRNLFSDNTSKNVNVHFNESIVKNPTNKLGRPRSAEIDRKYYQISPYSGRYFWAMNVERERSRRHHRELDPNECEPNVCIPYECDPYECQKLILKRLSRRSRSSNTSISSSRSSYAGKKKRGKKVDYEPGRGRKVPRPKPVKPVPEPKPDEPKAVRIGSAFKFNVEFSKQRTLPPKTRRQRDSESSASLIKKCLCTLKFQKRPGGPKMKTEGTGESKSRKLKSGESKSGESKSGEPKSGEPKSGEPKSGGEPKNLKKHKCVCEKEELKEKLKKEKAEAKELKKLRKKCLCPIEPPEPPKPAESVVDTQGTMTKKRKGKIRPHAAHAGQMTKPYKSPRILDPHECEPYICIPEQCDPAICLDRIKQRLYRDRGQSPGISESRKMKQTQSKACAQIGDTGGQGPGDDFNRQAVKIGSTFNVSVEFYKDKTPMDIELQAAARALKYPKRKHKGIHAPKYDPYSSRACSTTGYYRERESQSEYRSETMSAGTLRRCFCTLKLHKQGRLARETVTFVKDENVRTESAKTEPDLYSRGMSAGHKLLDYECEPGICTPGECDPYICERRIQRRLLIETGTSTDRQRLRDYGFNSSVSVLDKDTGYSPRHGRRFRRRRRGEKYSSGSGFSRVSDGKGGFVYIENRRQAVRLGSDFRFNVEFYKDKKTPKHIADHMRKKEYTSSYAGRDARQKRGKHVQLDPRYYQDTESQIEGQRREGSTMTQLKRCFCTLALRRPSTANQNKSKPNVEQAVYRIVPIQERPPLMNIWVPCACHWNSRECVQHAIKNRYKIKRSPPRVEVLQRKERSLRVRSSFISDVLSRDTDPLSGHNMYNYFCNENNGKCGHKKNVDHMETESEEILSKNRHFRRARYEKLHSSTQSLSLTGINPLLKKSICTLRLTDAQQNGLPSPGIRNITMTNSNRNMGGHSFFKNTRQAASHNDFSSHSVISHENNLSIYRILEKNDPYTNLKTIRNRNVNLKKMNAKIRKNTSKRTKAIKVHSNHKHIIHDNNEMYFGQTPQFKPIDKSLHCRPYRRFKRIRKHSVRDVGTFTRGDRNNVICNDYFSSKKAYENFNRTSKNQQAKRQYCYLENKLGRVSRDNLVDPVESRFLYVEANKYQVGVLHTVKKVASYEVQTLYPYIPKKIKHKHQRMTTRTKDTSQFCLDLTKKNSKHMRDIGAQATHNEMNYHQYTSSESLRKIFKGKMDVNRVSSTIHNQRSRTNTNTDVYKKQHTHTLGASNTDRFKKRDKIKLNILKCQRCDRRLKPKIFTQKKSGGFQPREVLKNHLFSNALVLDRSQSSQFQTNLKESQNKVTARPVYKYDTFLCSHCQMYYKNGDRKSKKFAFSNNKTNIDYSKEYITKEDLNHAEEFELTSSTESKDFKVMQNVTNQILRTKISQAKEKMDENIKFGKEIKKVFSADDATLRNENSFKKVSQINLIKVSGSRFKKQNFCSKPVQQMPKILLSTSDTIILMNKDVSNKSGSQLLKTPITNITVVINRRDVLVKGFYWLKSILSKFVRKIQDSLKNYGIIKRHGELKTIPERKFQLRFSDTALINKDILYDNMSLLIRREKQFDKIKNDHVKLLKLHSNCQSKTRQTSKALGSSKINSSVKNILQQGSKTKKRTKRKIKKKNCLKKNRCKVITAKTGHIRRKETKSCSSHIKETIFSSCDSKREKKIKKLLKERLKGSNNVSDGDYSMFVLMLGKKPNFSDRHAYPWLNLRLASLLNIWKQKK